MFLCGSAIQGWADPTSHADEDTFARDAAMLLPTQPPPVPKPPPNPTDRIVMGDWSTPIAWTPHVPVSAAMLPDGRVLTFASNLRNAFPPGPEFTYAATWDPATGRFDEYNHDSHDMFCGGLSLLPDGRLLVAGGRSVTVRASIFDWKLNSWTRVQEMNDPRWYNTSVALPDGRVWTVSGSGGSNTSEIWDFLGGWSDLPGIEWYNVVSEPGYITYWHPFLVLAPNGKLLHFGPTSKVQWVSLEDAGEIIDTGARVPGVHYPKEASWVVYNEGKILVAGGGASIQVNTNEPSVSTGTSARTAYTVDMNGATPVLTPTSSMIYARQFANCVVLPTGEVMVMGGNTSGVKFSDVGSILTPEIWNPDTGQWRALADMSIPRNYHSWSLLLPDGRVISAGGGLASNAADHPDAQLFTPPSLFRPDGTLATRPVLLSAPKAIGVGSKFTVTGTPGLTKFSFIKLSALTHSMNTDLRLLSLAFTETSSGTYEITSRSSLNVMTPGYWMLFGVDAANVYSVAKIIAVDSAASVEIMPVGDQSNYLGQSANLSLIGQGPIGANFTWSATGLPSGLSLDPVTGKITGASFEPNVSFVHVTLTDGTTTASTDFAWTYQLVTANYSFPSFTNATGFTLNGSASVVDGVLRLTPAAVNRVGSAFITEPFAVGTNTSISTRWVYRIHGAGDGGNGLAFVLQGNAPNVLGTAGTDVGYAGIPLSLAIQIENRPEFGVPASNHVGIVADGYSLPHLAQWVPDWDLEDGQKQTVWLDYDGPANQLRVYLAQGDSTNRPPTPQLAITVDLQDKLGGQAWMGFTAGTSGQTNNHDIVSWTATVNAYALPSAPVLALNASQASVVNSAVAVRLQATDANGDILSWSASGLPPGLQIDPSTGLVTGTPTTLGVFNPTITVNDGTTGPVSGTLKWSIVSLLTVQPLAGAPVVAGGPMFRGVRVSGGLNPVFRWSFGDGTRDTSFSSSSSTVHLYASPGRYQVTVTVRDDTGREVTSSYRQAVYLFPTDLVPTSSSDIAYQARGSGGDRLWVVNPDTDSVSVFDPVAKKKLTEIPVGTAPRTLAVAPDGRVWVANTESATLSIIQTNFSVISTIALPKYSRPFGVVFDPKGSNAFVALEGGSQVLRLHPATGLVLGSVDVGPNVRHLGIDATSSNLFATRFISPPVPGESTAAPQTTVDGVKYGGEVVVVDLASFTVTNKVTLEHSEQIDTSNSAHGIPNYLGAPVISPDGTCAWVPSKQDNIKRGLRRNGGGLTHDMTMRSIASRILLDRQVEEIEGRVDFDNAGVASAAAFDSKGIFLFVALEANRQVAVVDAWARREIMRFNSGKAPQGLVVSPDLKTLYVNNFMDRTLSIFDISTLYSGSELPLPAPTVLSTIAAEKLSPSVFVGKQLFYDAGDTRVAFQGYVSCAGCHNDGGHDGRVWDFTQFGEGLRNTITLRGHGGTAEGPLHWTGNFDEVQDFEGQIRTLALGTGLMSDVDFHTGTRSDPLGTPKAGVSPDLDALANYVSSLSDQGISPYRNTDGTFTASAIAGQTVFRQQNCGTCHSGPHFTDSALGLFHDIGTLKPTSGQRLGQPLTGIDTPTLQGLWATAPYLHDGSAPTLADAIEAHNGVSLSPTDMTNLVALLLQLDRNTDLKSVTITWTNPADIQYGTQLSPDQLNASASVAGTFVYNPPLGTRLPAGSQQVLSVRFLPADPFGFLTATQSVFLNVTPAPLVVSADNLSRPKGVSNPPLTVSYSGLVPGDDPGGLGLNLVLSTSAQSQSDVGGYPILVSGGTTLNYAVTYQSGLLTVTPPTPLSLSIAPLTLDLLLGQSAALQAQSTLSDSTQQDVSALATWSSADPSVVSVDTSGHVTAVAVGQVSIVATLGGLSATSVVSSIQTHLSQSFQSSNQIYISRKGPATPYPSVLTVQGFQGVIQKATVQLLGLTHRYPDQLDILLVSPQGTKVLLMSDAGGDHPVSNLDLVFDSDASAVLPDSTEIVSGTYKPTNYDNGDLFYAPAPALPYPSDLTLLEGENPNGDWSLFVLADSGSVGHGLLDRGWSLTLSSSVNSSPTLTALADTVIQEDQILGPVVFQISDAETPVQELKVTANSSNPGLVKDDQILLGGTGTNRTLSLKPERDQSGTTLIRVMVSDGSMVVSNSFTLTVQPVNDPPIISVLTDQTIAKNALSIAQWFRVWDAETPASNLVVTATSSSQSLVPDANIIISGTDVDRSLSIQPNANQTGVATITLTVDDGQGGVATGSMNLSVSEGTAVATTCASTLGLRIPTLGSADPYPSQVTLSGASGTIQQIAVHLVKVSHTYPDDLDILLVAPNGQSVLLMSDAGGPGDLVGATLVFDSQATDSLPDALPISEGVYRPTNFDSRDFFPPPAPLPPYGSDFSAILGTNPNGVWSLYVVDDTEDDAGEIAGGWFLTVTTSTPSLASLDMGGVVGDLPRLSILPQTSGGEISVRVQGRRNVPYEIQVSEDLQHWSSIKTVLTGAENFEADRIVLPVALRSNRFYRALSGAVSR